MDELPQIVTGNTVSEQPNVMANPLKNKTPLKKKLDTIFTIIFSVCIFLAVFAGIYYLGTGKSLVPQIQKAAKPTGTMFDKTNSETTQKTQIAKSLDVPPLYKGLQWKEEKISVNNESNRKITGFKTGDLKNVINIPLVSGKIYGATGSASTYENIYNYFKAPLEKSGWVVADHTTDVSLVFKSLTLEPIIANGPCGGENGYVGYKNGFVRVITEIDNVAPCLPDGSEETVHVESSIDYTVFISDPTPLNYFVDYIVKHANK